MTDMASRATWPCSPCCAVRLPPCAPCSASAPSSPLRTSPSASNSPPCTGPRHGLDCAFLQRLRGASRANRDWLALALLLLPFGVYKLRDLALPYFWDELGVYARAAVYLAAAGLLLAQPLFLAQSTLLLPEIPLALACLWSMHSFSAKKYLAAGIFIGIAIFLKETAVVLTAALAVLLVVQWLRARSALKSEVGGILALAIPGLL